MEGAGAPIGVDPVLESATVLPGPGSGRGRERSLRSWCACLGEGGKKRVYLARDTNLDARWRSR